jgi:hypothetical protein
VNLGPSPKTASPLKPNSNTIPKLRLRETHASNICGKTRMYKWLHPCLCNCPTETGHLLLAKTGRGHAENSLAEDRDNTAAGALATVGADVAEVADAEGVGGGRVAVQVSDAEDIGSAALGNAVETLATASSVRGGVGVGGSGRDGGGEEAEDGDEGGLHFE